jgi:hypothetical protein
MRLLKSSSQQRYQSCRKLLGEAISKLERPLSARLIHKGWTEEDRENLLRLVQNWNADFIEDRAIRRRHFRIATRWFEDSGLHWRYVSRRMGQVDGIINRTLHMEH